MGIVAPSGMGLIAGLSTAVSLGAASKTEDGAVLRDVVALHVSLSMSLPYSVSTQIATLRHLLLSGHSAKASEANTWSQLVSKVRIPALYV